MCLITCDSTYKKQVEPCNWLGIIAIVVEGYDNQ